MRFPVRDKALSSSLMMHREWTFLGERESLQLDEISERCTLHWQILQKGLIRNRPRGKNRRGFV